MLVGSSIVANASMEDYNVLARREEETIRLRAEAMELNNLKAVDVDLVKEKAAAEAAVKEAEERGAKVLKEVDAHRARLNKAMEELKNRVTIIEEVSARATEAEARAREAEEARDGLATSLSKVTVDHLWMREHGIRHEDEVAGGAKNDAGTSGTKAD
ncbi:hypothetical protein Hanom_Chr12g01167881 [Helianthus anomalus]